MAAPASPSSRSLEEGSIEASGVLIWGSIGLPSMALLASMHWPIRGLVSSFILERAV